MRYKITNCTCNNNALISGRWVRWDESKLADFVCTLNEREQDRIAREERDKEATT